MSTLRTAGERRGGGEKECWRKGRPLPLGTHPESSTHCQPELIHIISNFRVGGEVYNCYSRGSINIV